MQLGIKSFLPAVVLLLAAPLSAQDEPFRTPEAEGYRAHANDERVSLANLRWGVEFYFRLMQQLTR